MQKNDLILTTIAHIAEERQINQDLVISSLEDAMGKAYMKEFPEELCEVKIDKTTGLITVLRKFLVVRDDAEELNEYCEMTLSEAKKLNKNINIGDEYKQSFNIDTLERRVVTHMLQVFKHSISTESNKEIYREWLPKKGTIITAEVEKVDVKTRTALINLDKTKGSMPRAETNPDEKIVPGVSYRFYIKDVLEQTKAWPVILSRADAELIKNLLITNIPELQDKVVEIVKIARVAGFKTKVVVKSNQAGVDPVGSCIGARADRIRPILKKMGSEKIEFVEYDENFSKYLSNICNPAPLFGYKVYEPETEEERKRIVLIVDEFKLALIIGSRGKNVRLLSSLLDANIDIKTIDEAKLEGIDFVRHSHGPSNTQTTTTARPVNKFASTYKKYQDSGIGLTGIGLNDQPDAISSADLGIDQKTSYDVPVEHESKQSINYSDADSQPTGDVDDSIAQMEELIKNVSK